MFRAATFSRLRTYRYTLDIQVAEGPLKRVQFIGLNPSTADEKVDDATMRRLKRYTLDWGYTMLTMTNLFAFRARDPLVMKRHSDPIGRLNNAALEMTAASSDLIVACWGTHGTWRSRDQEVLELLDAFELHCFARSRDGHPLHPLRLLASLKPQRYTP